MKIKFISEKILFVGVIGVSIILLFFIIACTWIGYEVKNQCHEAKREYAGDCVESLTGVLKDENKSYRARNNAIWALGQLGDSRALPVLKNFYTGNIPPREPLDKMISQYELKKAVNLTSGGLNITSVFWRYGIND